jgi:hypothetical protein
MIVDDDPVVVDESIKVFYNIVRRMIVRGFSLAVLFTANKTTLVW